MPRAYLVKPGCETQNGSNGKHIGRNLDFQDTAPIRKMEVHRYFVVLLTGWELNNRLGDYHFSGAEYLIMVSIT